MIAFLRKGIGIALYFATLWLWVILLSLFVLLSLPPTLLLLGIGYFLRPFQTEWRAFKELWIWECIRMYWFQFTIEGDDTSLILADIAANGNSGDGIPTLYAIYPHGTYALTTMFFWALNPAWKHARGAVHSILFYIPIVNMLVGWCGMTSVTEADLVAAIEKDGRVYMCPGGIRDVANRGNNVTKRSGFLRVARQCKCRVVPIWCPDERAYYRQWLPFGKTLEGLLYFPFPIIVWGQWWCPFLPRSTPKSRIRVGKAIEYDDENGEDVFWERLRRLQD